MKKLKTLFQKKKKQPFEYKALIFVPSVDSMQSQLVVETKLSRDPEDLLLYLVDTDTGGKNFKELFPGENKKIFNKEELPNLKKKLTTIEKKLKDFKKESTDNRLNLDKEMSKLKVLISQMEEPKGSFVIQNGAGEKSIYYLRKSSGLSPIHFDIHSNVAYSPTEKQSRDAFNIWKTKYENLKANPPMPFEKITATIAGVVLTVLCIILAVLGWNWYQHEADWDKAMLNQKYICQSTTLEELQSILETNKQTSNMLNDFAQKTFDLGPGEIQAPQTTTIG